MLAPWKESYDEPRLCIIKQRHHFTDTGSCSQNYGFSSGHIWMWELDHREDCVLKNWGFQIVALKKTFERPLDKKEIKPVNPKGNQPRIFTGRTHAEAEAPILWSANTKSWLIGKDSDAGNSIEGKMRRGWQRMRWLESIINSMDSNLRKAAVHEFVKSWTQLNDWKTTTNLYEKRILKRMIICICIIESFCCTAEITQHCKSTILQ